MRIVEGWPRNFDAGRAVALGFRADSSFEDIIRIHLQDELQKSDSTRRARLAGELHRRQARRIRRP